MSADTGTMATMPRHHWKHAVEVAARQAGVDGDGWAAIAIAQVVGGGDRLTLWYVSGETVSDAVEMLVTMARERTAAIRSWDSPETLRAAMAHTNCRCTR